MEFDPGKFELIANGATIATAVIALIAFFQFHWIRRSRRRRTERLLKHCARERGQLWRTVRGLSIELGIAENEIIDASHRSGNIVRLPLNDTQGMAFGMMLAWACPESRKMAQEAYSVMCAPDRAQQSSFFWEKYLGASQPGFDGAPPS